MYKTNAFSYHDKMASCKSFHIKRSIDNVIIVYEKYSLYYRLFEIEKKNQQNNDFFNKRLSLKSIKSSKIGQVTRIF